MGLRYNVDKISTTRRIMLLFKEHILFLVQSLDRIYLGHPILFSLFSFTVDQVLVKSHEFTTPQVDLAFTGVIVGWLLEFARAPI